MLAFNHFQSLRRCTMKISHGSHSNFGISALAKGNLHVREMPSDFSHFASGVTIDDQSKKCANGTRRLKLSKNASVLVGRVETGFREEMAGKTLVRDSGK